MTNRLEANTLGLFVEIHSGSSGGVTAVWRTVLNYYLIQESRLLFGGTAHAAKSLFLKTIIKDHPRSNEITDSEPLVPT